MKSALMKWGRLVLSSSREFFLHFFYNTSPCDLARYCKNNEEKIPGRSWEISAPIKRYGFRKRWGRFGLQRKSESIRSLNFKIFYYTNSYVWYLRYLFCKASCDPILLLYCVSAPFFAIKGGASHAITLQPNSWDATPMNSTDSQLSNEPLNVHSGPILTDQVSIS